MNNSLTYATLIDQRDPTTVGYLGTLALSPDNGYIPQAIEIDMPEVRAVSENWSDRDGNNDTTTFFGPRAVTLTLALLPERVAGTEQALRERVTQWLHPALRPRLEFQLDEADTPRSIQLRFAQGASFTEDFTTVSFSGLAIGWVAPSGVLEAVSSLSITVIAGANAVELGRSYNLSYDRTYPAQPFPGGTFVNNPGTLAVFPTIYLYGQCTNPVLENKSTGQKLSFTANGGVSLANGEYILIDTRARTAYRNGDTTNSVLSKLDFTVSQWFDLDPGSSQLSFYPATSTSTSAAILTFRPAYL